MFAVSDFITYTARAGSSIYSKLPGLDPRDPALIPAGVAEVTVTPTGLTNGTEIYAFFERLRNSSRVTVGGVDYPTVYDPYMGRSKCLIKLTYNGSPLVFRLNLTDPPGPEIASAGTLQLFKVSDVLTVSDDVFAIYPLNLNTLPRTTSEPREDDSAVVKVLGDEPRLTINLNLTVKGDYADDTDVNSDFQKLLKIISPQNSFVFQARQDWQTWVIGLSEDRVIRHSYDAFNRQSIRNVPLEAA